MMTTNKPIMFPGESYTSVRATPELVGFLDEREAIREAVTNGHPSYLIYITGIGGIGKTRLLKHMLQELQTDSSLLVASDLVDLYHSSVHTIEGMLGALERTLAIQTENFASYRWARDVLERQIVDRPDQYAKIKELRQDMLTAFISDLEKLADGRRIVIALDTAEKLIFPEDPIAEQLGETSRSEILHWLLADFLPKVSKLAILLAGRPAPRTFKDDLREASDAHFIAIELKGLNEAESLEYFSAVANVARDSGNAQDKAVPKVIDSLSTEDRQAIFYALCDSEEPPHIRPILLALAIDYLVVAGQPLSGLLRSLPEARAMAKDERQKLQDELGSALTTLLHEDWRPADEIIVALGWLRKGATIELLTRITPLEEHEIKENLNKIRSLSFVKIRPQDDRIFLHDEMYKMLWDHLLNRLTDVRRERVLNSVITYYSETINELEDHIAQLYEPGIDSRDTAKTREIIASRYKLQDYKVEDLHYRLERNAGDGFRAYFRYAEEAVFTHDRGFDVRLRTELFNFIRERDPSGQLDLIDSTLRRSDVKADTAVRWIKRFHDENHQRAIEAAEIIRQNFDDLIGGGGLLARAELNSWEGLSRIFGGQVGEAKTLLKEYLKELEKHTPRTIRWAAILASTYYNLGFLYRSQGKHFGAIYYYERAIPLLRAAKIAVQQATTLNNRAFALAEIGDFRTAEPLAWDALHLRERTGSRLWVCLSLTTLAHIKIRENALEEARHLAERALKEATVVDYYRGRGLALVALAESKRRSSNWEPNTPEQTVSLLQEAAQHAKESAQIFETKGEHLRQAEALIEYGCSCRDWARIKHERNHVEGDLAHLIEKSRKLLTKAAEIAKETRVDYLAVDALVNLAWLNYYVAIAWDKQLERDILKLIGPDYQIHDQMSATSLQKRLTEEDEKEVIYSYVIQLAKLETLRGHIAFDKFNPEDNNSEIFLEESLKHYTLTMLYDTIITQGIVHRGMRKSMEQIYDHLRPLNMTELRLVYELVAKLEGQYGPRESSWPMYHFLEKEFGPYELIVDLAQFKEITL